MFLICFRCQYCRLKKCLEKGMRSDSPRVAAASEARRSSNSGGGPANKRASLDIDLNGLTVKAEAAAYASPTLLPRQSFMPKAAVPVTPPPPLLAPPEAALPTAAAIQPSPPEGLSFSDSGSSVGGDSLASASSSANNLLSQTMDSLMARINNLEELAASDNEEEISCVLADRPLLDAAGVRFDLNLPSPATTQPSIHFVCETASRLLFKTMHWAKGIPSFSLLSLDLQVELVRRSWAGLFVLGLAQLAGRLSVPSLLSLAVSHQQARLAGDTGLDVKEVAETVCKIHQFVKTLANLQLDDTEFAYLKAILIFSEGNILLIICYMAGFSLKDHF